LTGTAREQEQRSRRGAPIERSDHRHVQHQAIAIVRASIQGHGEVTALGFDRRELERMLQPAFMERKAARGGRPRATRAGCRRAREPEEQQGEPVRPPQPAGRQAAADGVPRA
jgi:hypothetical protein